MLKRYKQGFSDQGLKARAMRSSLWTFFSFGGTQAVRLASNLILTRLLFPEAFGLMALIVAVMIGLSMVSDAGISPSIQQNKRGDDPDFLNTAWTMQVARGTILWLASCALAYPLASFYNEPALLMMLPVAGISLLIEGFKPTRVETAGRHLMIGRVMLLDFIGQTIGVIAMVALALVFKSIWVLVAGVVIASAAKVTLYMLFLTGERNHFRWESQSVNELFHFGKWIYISTIAGFIATQGDRIILGKFLTIELLGIYSIGFFIASFPFLLGDAVLGRILIPLYREKPPSESAENFRQLRQMRFAATSGLLGMTVIIAMLAPIIVSFLYDPRYSAAGGIATLISITMIPQVILQTYDRVALAAGDSRNFCLYVVARSTTQISFFLIGVSQFGLVGALTGQFLANVAITPMLILLARRHKAWDPLHDATFAFLGLGLGLCAIWLNADAIKLLL